jgi:lipoprotein NlpI
MNRGYASFYTDNCDAAASDFARAIETDEPPSPYDLLWLYLARVRSRNQNAAASELETNAAKLSPLNWPRALVELFLGSRTPEATLAAAASTPGELCAAEFYVGEWYLLQQDHAAAMKHLEASTDACPKWGDPEYEGAQAELKRLR